jgi:hypothetical protein
VRDLNLGVWGMACFSFFSGRVGLWCSVLGLESERLGIRVRGSEGC